MKYKLYIFIYTLLYNNTFLQYQIMGLPTLLRNGNLLPAMGEKKEDLDKYRPIDYILEWFNKRLVENYCKSIDDRIIVAESTTGSGKSTVLPTELYLKFKDDLKGGIIVTQPRVLTAVDIPKTIVNVPVYKDKLILGVNIGHQTKEYVKKPIEKGILFSTIGVLLQFLKNMEPEKFCKKYNIIILDEAHERSTSLDLIFYYLKELIKKVPLESYPYVILTSGTMDVNKYTKYFNTKTVFRIQGDSYPIVDNFLSINSTNIIQSALEKIKDIHENGKNDDKHSSDIVVFVPVNAFIKKLKEGVEELNEKYFKTRKILPIGLDSGVFKSASIDYQYVFNDIDRIPIKNITRKVIIGTNAIETGITLETISYCIDLGLVNVLEYNPYFNVNILTVRPVTQAMSKQRRGRVGRIREGQFFGLYEKETFNKLQNIQYPEIITNNMTIPLLNILCTGGENKGKDILDSLDMLDNIPEISKRTSLEKLYNHGAIDIDYNPTEIGKIINKVRMISLENIKMILSGYHFGCNIMDLITIASYIEIGKQSIVTPRFKSFNIDFGKDKNIDIYNFNKLKSRLFISCEFIEFLIFFYEFKEVMKKNKTKIDKTIKFCESNKVNFSGMITLIEFRDEIIRDLLSNMNINPNYNGDINIYHLAKKSNQTKLTGEFVEEIIKIKNCIYNGYKMNTAIYDSDKNCYISIYNNMELTINSPLIKNMPNLNNGKKFEDVKPKYIIYDSLMLKKDRNTNNYNCEVVNCISAMSGFVNINFDLF